jgi:PAS domain S-box-containing protein
MEHGSSKSDEKCTQCNPARDDRLSRWLLEGFYSNQREGICIHELLSDKAGIPTDYRILAANRACESILGIAVDAAVGQLASELYGAEEAPYLTEYAKVVSAGSTTHFEAFFPPMGKHFDILIVPLKEKRFATLFSDITERKQAEPKLFRTSQALKMLSVGTKLLVRASTLDELLHGMCLILVGTGGYRLAWVGRAEGREAKVIVPVAHAGHEEGFLQEVDLPWGSGPSGHLPELDCMQEQCPIVASNIRSDRRYAACREELLSRGYASSIALPLIIGGSVWGTLAVYASEPDAFDADERAILQEMADNIASGIEGFQRQTELVASENLHRAVFETASAGIALIEEDTTIALVNTAFETLSGCSKEELEGKKSWTEFVVPEDLASMTEHHKARRSDRDAAPAEYSFGFVNRDGQRREVLVAVDMVSGTRRSVASLLDITALKKAEASLREMLDSLIRVLGSTTASRDPYTAGHQERVTSLAVAIAQEMVLSDECVQGIRHAGIVHDIGKMSVPAEILTKPTTLTATEYELIKVHPVVAFDILKDVAFPWPVADIILQHHERIDGSGYPAGLQGEEIRLEARILAVADVVEAMASHRPYRPALGIEAALQEIRDNKGTKYDAEVVEACLRVFESGYTFATAE